MRVLITGWPSFLDGEATAGDVLAMEAVHRAIATTGVPCDAAWSPVFRPAGPSLADASPDRYTHLVFACGPVQGEQIRRLHERYRHCRRIAVGVSVIDPSDSAVQGFHTVLARDGDGTEPRRDLAAEPSVPDVPVVGVLFAPRQPEYGPRRRHERVESEIISWLAERDCAPVPLDTRLDGRPGLNAATPAQFEAIVRRMDLVVTTRLHGLVLALKNGVPALAIDPVEGGAKVGAQARAWDWPAVVVAGPGTPALDVDALGRYWDWCLSGGAAARAWECAGPSESAADPVSLSADLLDALGLQPDLTG
ncbi:polysaccharide pyruvyl transferase family protein [Actinomadura craniellae]|uniref:Polysaccharide pyruvyl transferase family protein n=1 Tax=Actinomadura craniellae TaxID=2231787 RepID=A0A365H282_9ACTN|nr:polysaccharide pyruvyl transferase family protein [Actinomadura craniellae]RAY13215.1 polysaccharide pyruvyl transferase family protein [Actinomadura craniellae]